MPGDLVDITDNIIDIFLCLENVAGCQTDWASTNSDTFANQPRDQAIQAINDYHQNAINVGGDYWENCKPRDSVVFKRTDYNVFSLSHRQSFLIKLTLLPFL